MLTRVSPKYARLSWTGFALLWIAACNGGTDAAPGPDGDDAGASSGEPGSASSGGAGASSGEPGSTSSSGEPGSTSSSGEPGTGSSSGEPAAPPTCTDGLKNGDESDVDCGYACDVRCAAGQSCNGLLDCESGRCTDGLCAAVSDSDGIKNGHETDVDCGGPDARPCAAPRRCLQGSDCASQECSDQGTCVASHFDGSRNLDESDIDCGGSAERKCSFGRRCASASDCADEGVCLGNVCQAPSHNDGVKNLGETDVDCGNAAPARCNQGHQCALDADCSNILFCDVSVQPARCALPAIDGQTNGSETDIDCGGLGRSACVAGQGCVLASDCVSGVCSAGAPSAPAPAGGCAQPAQGAGPFSCAAAAAGARRCAAPSAQDGIKNGSESDVDCGGDAANPRCVTGQRCVAHDDCASEGCHATDKVCVQRRSCAVAAGGSSCGPTEAGGEDCCATARVARTPATAVELGKYLITAGRFRQMIERTGGDVRGYIEGLGLPARRWNPAWTQWLPRNPVEVAQRLGPYAQPDESGFGTISGARGCQVSLGGGRSYWFNAGDGGGLIQANEVGKYAHDVLDGKIMNCLMPPMAAAFCIWDGGDLAEDADVRFAWHGAANAAGTVVDTRRWPWGAAPEPPTSRYGANVACQGSNCNRFIVHQWNYLYPAYIASDSSVHIPAPGRRAAGVGPLGHFDLAGASYQYAKRTPAAANGVPVTIRLNSGSFEGHAPVANLSTTSGELSRRYWAYAAGRCAYPVQP